MHTHVYVSVQSKMEVYGWILYAADLTEVIMTRMTFTTWRKGGEDVCALRIGFCTCCQEVALHVDNESGCI